MSNILKVYGEDLVAGELNTASLSHTQAVKAGSTQGALCVNVFANGETALKNTVTVTLKHGDTADGGFAEIGKIVIESGRNFADEALMATYSLPADVKDYVIADVTSNVANSGRIRVTLGYLAR